MAPDPESHNSGLKKKGQDQRELASHAINIDNEVVEFTAEPQLESPSSDPSTEQGFHSPEPMTFWEEIKDEYSNLKQSMKGAYTKAHNKKKNTSRRDVLDTVFPCLIWMRTYNLRADLPRDLISGLSVGLMVVPQAISYAALVGVPPQYGLYTALVPVVVHTFTASSLQMCVGPVAVTSIMYGQSLQPLMPNDMDFDNPKKIDAALMNQYIIMVLQVAFLVGWIEFATGLFRLGWLTQLLSHSVILGFTAGTAIIIALSQLKYILGVKVDRVDTVQEYANEYANAIDDFEWQSFVFGVSLMILIYATGFVGRLINKRHPAGLYISYMGPLLATVVGITLTWGCGVNVPLVGKVPSGLPPWSFDILTPMNDVGTLFGKSLLIAGVAILESVAIAKVLATRNKYHFDANTELRSLGLSNIIGAGFSAYAATGSFSRSAVIDNTGGKSPLTGLGGAFVVFLTLLWLMTPLSYMPKCAIGAIIITGVLTLIEFKAIWKIFRLSKKDFVVWLASFCGVLFMGIEIGLGIAVGLAILLVLYESAFPYTAVLGRISGSEVFKDVGRFPTAKVTPGVLVYRMDADLYFANSDSFKDKLAAKMGKLQRHYGKPVTHVIIDLSGVTHMDTTGLKAINETIDMFQLQTPPIQLALAVPNKRVDTLIERDRTYRRLFGGVIFSSVYDAALAVAQDQSSRSKEAYSVHEEVKNCKTDTTGICTHRCPEGVWDLARSEKAWNAGLTSLNTFHAVSSGQESSSVSPSITSPVSPAASVEGPHAFTI